MQMQFDENCPIQRQINGLLIHCNQNEKVEYHLKTKSGALMAIFQTEELAKEYRNERLKKWGSKAPIGFIYRVTTITEQLHGEDQ